MHGEGLSGACLEISGDGKLLDATVAGKEIEDSKEYKVATLDYLAEGNDHMTALPKWAMRINCCLKRPQCVSCF